MAKKGKAKQPSAPAPRTAPAPAARTPPATESAAAVTRGDELAAFDTLPLHQLAERIAGFARATDARAQPIAAVYRAFSAGDHVTARARAARVLAAPDAPLTELGAGVTIAPGWTLHAAARDIQRRTRPGSEALLVAALLGGIVLLSLLAGHAHG